MGYISTGMNDLFSALLVSLMALWLTLVDRNPFRPYYVLYVTCHNNNDTNNNTFYIHVNI